MRPVTLRHLEMTSFQEYYDYVTNPKGLSEELVQMINVVTTNKTDFFRIVPELRKQVTFRRLNLLEGSDFGIKQRMDIIFCRNIIIYFDHETQKRLFEKYYAQLTPGGYMFIGHSETLHGINADLVPVGSAVYKKPE